MREIKKNLGRVTVLAQTVLKHKTRVCLTPKPLLLLLYFASVPLLEVGIPFHSQK